MSLTNPEGDALTAVCEAAELFVANQMYEGFPQIISCEVDALEGGAYQARVRTWEYHDERHGREYFDVEPYVVAAYWDLVIQNGEVVEILDGDVDGPPSCNLFDSELDPEVARFLLDTWSNLPSDGVTVDELVEECKGDLSSEYPLVALRLEHERGTPIVDPIIRQAVEQLSL